MGKLWIKPRKNTEMLYTLIVWKKKKKEIILIQEDILHINKMKGNSNLKRWLRRFDLDKGSTNKQQKMTLAPCFHSPKARTLASLLLSQVTKMRIMAYRPNLGSNIIIYKHEDKEHAWTSIW